MRNKFPFVYMTALVIAAAAPLFVSAALAEEKAKPHAQRQEKVKPEAAKPQAAKPKDKDSGAMDSSEDSESEQKGTEGDGSQD